MRTIKFLISILAGLALLALPAPTAQAAVPRIPLTCGMVVSQDAEVFLARDLTCPDFGVRVEQEPGEPGPGPSVVINLRGPTLRGSGVALGISANNAGGSDHITVVNGRLTHWDIAVAGDWDTRTRNVAFAANRVAFFCSGVCVADRSTFTASTEVGFFVGGEADGTVMRSTFVRNAVGAYVSYPLHLRIDRSIFLHNKVGVIDAQTIVPISNSLFVKNGTAVEVWVDDLGGCVELHRVVFVRNGVRVDGPVC